MSGSRGPISQPQSRHRGGSSSGDGLVLPAGGREGEIPELPNKYRGRKYRRWLQSTRRWWERLWRSPQAAAFTATDVDELVRLADLIDQHTRSGDVELLREIRLQRKEFGLTPEARKRLHWIIAAHSRPDVDDGAEEVDDGLVAKVIELRGLVEDGGQAS